MILPVIGISFWLFTFRTSESRYWRGSVYAEPYKSPESHNYKRGEFLILDHGCLMNILGLLCNVATLALNVATLQRRDVSTSRRHFDPPLERRDVGYKRRDVDFDTLWNVATLISNIATSILTILWNVATLISNVTTLILHLSGTSRR